MAENRKPDILKNVIIFGEAGSGKSSVVNMLIGENAAEVSDSAIGCTFDFKCFPYREYNFIDTIGLSEGSHGTIDYKIAISSLAKFIKSLQNGVNLLIFVTRKDRIKKTLEENYKLFVETICMNKVPVILVVTHCEQEKVMGLWWNNNKTHFDAYGMKFAECVCVCATRGEDMAPIFAELLQTRYNQSRDSVLQSIKTSILKEAWKMENWIEWLGIVIKRIWNLYSKIFKLPLATYWPKLKEHFIVVGMDDKTATQLSNEIYENSL